MTKTLEPTGSAAERLSSARIRSAALRSEDQNLQQELTQRLLDGSDVADIRERRGRIGDELGDLALLIRELERLAVIEERQQILRDCAQAELRQADVQQRIDKQKIAVDRAIAACHDAEEELFRLRNASTGRFAAQMRLTRHRESYPDINEGAC